MAFRLIRTLSTIVKHVKKSTCCVNSTHFVKRLAFPLTLFTLAKCESDSPITASFHLNEESLEHEFLIKQACTVNVNSASQLLTVTVVAIQDTSQKIRESLSHEISLIRQALEWGDNVTPEEHWERLIGVRGRLLDLNHNLRMLNSYMEYAERLATVVAEISFLSGNTAASDALCQRIDQASRVCKREMDENYILQTESLDLQQMAISTSTQMEELLKSDADPKLSRPDNNKKNKS